MSRGYWGPVTATIDWCEPNYVYTTYVAEFWNTLSNLTYIYVALMGFYQARKNGFEKSFQINLLILMLTGIGSGLYHGTLRYFEQQCDETPMIWCMLSWFYILFQSDLGKAKRQVFGWTLVTSGFVFSLLHAAHRFTTALQVLFVALGLSCMFRLCFYGKKIKKKKARELFFIYILSAVLGMACWLIDYHFCHVMTSLPVNPQGHAWWHIFSALHSYYGQALMQYIRAEERGWDPCVNTDALLPVVHVERQKKKRNR